MGRISALFTVKRVRPATKRTEPTFFIFSLNLVFFFIIFLGEGGRNLFGAGQILGISHPN